MIDAVTITAGDGVRGDAEDTADLLKGITMPELEHNGFPLRDGQPGELIHRGAFE